MYRIKKNNPTFVINGFTQIQSMEDFYSQNVPKVIIDKNNFLIYISRSPILDLNLKKKFIWIEKTSLYLWI